MKRVPQSLVALVAAGIIAFIFVAASHTQAEPPSDPVLRAMSDIQAISVQLKLYEALNGFLPTTKQGLKALVKPPDTDPKPTHWLQMMKAVPLDPWGNPYLYIQPGVKHPGSYDLFSAGPDGKPNTADDITN